MKWNLSYRHHILTTEGLLERGYLYAVEDDKQVLEYKRVLVDSKGTYQPRDPKYWHKNTDASNAGPINCIHKQK